jgi:hypothetical protein
LASRTFELEVIRRIDGTFDIFWNRKLENTGIAERWLSEEICARHGVCGEEYDNILRQLEQCGKAILIL